MIWPDNTEFTGAIQSPGLCFADPELRAGKVAYLRPGMPQAWSGSFAIVYRVSTRGGDFAVRCFTGEVKDQQQRYARLSEYLQRANLPGFVEFEYQPQGICVKSSSYPIIKMEWVNGQTLDKFVQANRHNPNTLKRVADKWRETAAELQDLPIAHNDLQHGNIIVQTDGSIRLVDYDGIFLPQFQGHVSPEEGHRNFQHPERQGRDYGAHIDNFPALVIHLSLLAVAADPNLWQHYNDDNLIFTKSDFDQPAQSNLFKTLKSNGDAAVRSLAALLEACCARPVADVPTLKNALQSGQSPFRKMLQQGARNTDSNAAYEHPERQQLQEQSQDSAVKIDREAILQFCRGLDGQTLKTPTRVAFTLRYSAPYIHIQQKSTNKSISESGFNNFLDQFEEIQSWNGRDYKGIEGTSTFCLAILRKYIDSHLVNILKTGTDLAAVQAASQAAAAQKFHSIETELQTTRRKAADAARKHQAELREAQKLAIDATRKLEAELQATRQQAADATGKLQTAQTELQRARQQAESAEIELAEAQAELAKHNDSFIGKLKRTRLRRRR